MAKSSALICYIKMGRKNKEIPLSSSEIKREKLRDVAATEDIDEIIALTKDSDPVVRASAVRSICPCRVYDKIDEFWNRVLEMINDEDETVRENVLHVLCDGSPDYLEDRIIEAVKTFNRDSNKYIKRRAHKVLGSYYKTGKWNVL
jgi:HEAT repeat protein